MLHGQGYYLQQGNRYEGTFQYGKANGYGRFFSAAGEFSMKFQLILLGDRYEGEFVEDLFHGNGICHYSGTSIIK